MPSSPSPAPSGAIAPNPVFAVLLRISPFFFWGTAMVAMKGVLERTTPFFLAGVRLLPAGILILLATVVLAKAQPRGWRACGAIALFALVDGALFQGFLAHGLARTGAGLGSVIIDSQPLAVALLSRWLFAETIGFWGWLGLAVGVVGISAIGLPSPVLSAAIAGGGLELLGPDRWLDALGNSGTVLMLGAALSMAVGTVMVPWVSRYVDPLVATGWHAVIGGIPLFALSGVWETGQWQQLQGADWLALGYATVFGSAIAYGVFFYFAARGNLTSLSALTFLTPIFALLFGSLLLGERLTPLQWAGVAATLTSVYFIERRATLLDKFDPLAQPLAADAVADAPSGVGEASPTENCPAGEATEERSQLLP